MQCKFCIKNFPIIERCCINTKSLANKEKALDNPLSLIWHFPTNQVGKFCSQTYEIEINSVVQH